MRTLNHIVCLVIVGAVGCGGDDGGGLPGTDGSSPDASTLLLPAPGRWSYATYTKTFDSCGGSVDGDGDFMIEYVSGGFRMMHESYAWNCTIDASAAFKCSSPPETRDYRPATDAVLTGSGTLSGHLSNPSLASGTQVFAVTCAGAECNYLNPGACGVTASVVLKKL